MIYIVVIGYILAGEAHVWIIRYEIYCINEINRYVSVILIN
jgi:hypothetical protein